MTFAPKTKKATYYVSSIVQILCNLQRHTVKAVSSLNLFMIIVHDYCYQLFFFCFKSKTEVFTNLENPKGWYSKQIFLKL